MRTIEQLEDSDVLIGHNISDTLAYCITAGDWLRAKRRRYPLSGFDKLDWESSTTQNYRALYEEANKYRDIMEIVGAAVTFIYAYPETAKVSDTAFYLFDLRKEYLEDD